MSKKKELAEAIMLATKAHDRQTDKAGEPYILHCLNVMNNPVGERHGDNYKICAVLHDYLEDTKAGCHDLYEMFGSSNADTIELLTHRKYPPLGEEEVIYEDYIQRILKSDNAIAIDIKIADLEHNMQVTRLVSLCHDDLQRVVKYHGAYKRLKFKRSILMREEVGERDLSLLDFATLSEADAKELGLPDEDTFKPLDVPTDKMDKDYDYTWKAYAINEKDLIEMHKQYEKDPSFTPENWQAEIMDNLKESASKGWRPVSATQYPFLLIPAIREYSTKEHVRYNGLILCERHKIIDVNYPQISTKTSLEHMRASIEIEGVIK